MTEKNIQDMTPAEARAELARIREAKARLERAAQIGRITQARALIEAGRDWRLFGIPEGEYHFVMRTLKGWIDTMAEDAGGAGGRAAATGEEGMNAERDRRECEAGS